MWACELSSILSARVFVAVGRLPMIRRENVAHKQATAEAIAGSDED